MIFRKIGAVCLCFALGVSEVQATIFNIHLPYTDVAKTCGKDDSERAFSDSDYVVALAEAAIALSDARKIANKEGRAAITKISSQLKKCQAEQETRFYILPMRNCYEFVNGYEAFSARAAALIKAAKFTENDRRKVREKFRKPAEDCIRTLTSSCVDPTDIEHIDLVIRAFQAASEFRFIGTYKGKSTVDRIMDMTNPFHLTMSLCIETDYYCRSQTNTCFNRTIQLSAIMQTFIVE